MEFICKNSKKEPAVCFQLSDLAVKMKWPGGQEEVHYSGVKTATITKTAGLYLLTLTTTEGARYVITNHYVHLDGRIEDKSLAYGLFVRVLYMHLRQKSKADFSFTKRYPFVTLLKYAWVPLSFVISFGAEAIGFSLFHPAVHGLALAATGLALIWLLESNKKVDGSIPMEFLPG